MYESTNTTRLRELYPGASSAPLEAGELAAAYAFPDGDAPWVRAMFVSSVDGAATLHGHAGELGNESDRLVFALLRALADVILVGDVTTRTEGYGPVEIAPQWQTLRAGRTPTPPIAVVSRDLDLDLSGPLFTAAPEHARTIVLTGARAARQRRVAVGKVADLVIAGEDLVEPDAAIRALHERGHRRISCEGGPRLLAHLVSTGTLDELCLTRSPVLVSGDAPRITDGPAREVPLGLQLAHLLIDEDYLFLRYRRRVRGR